jgi:hypothetical protein
MKPLSTSELAERGQRVSLVAKDFKGKVQMMEMMWLDRNRRFFVTRRRRLKTILAISTAADKRGARPRRH